MLVLLVNYDQAQVLHGGKDRAARAHHHPRIAQADAPPFVAALAVGESAVQNRRLRPEARAEPAHHLRREGDLRHEDDRAPARLERLGHHGQVHLGLAAAGDAVQKKRALAPPEGRKHRIQRLALVRSPFRGLRERRVHLAFGRTEHLALLQGNQPRRLQRVQRLARLVHQRFQLLDGARRAAGQQAKQRGPLRGAALGLRGCLGIHAGHEAGIERLFAFHATGAHRRGQHQPQRLGQRAVRLRGQLARQIQQGRQQRRAVVQHGADRAQLFGRQAVGRGFQQLHDDAVHPPPAQRHAHPRAHRHAFTLRHQVGKGVGHVCVNHVHNHLRDHGPASFRMDACQR